MSGRPACPVARLRRTSHAVPEGRLPVPSRPSADPSVCDRARRQTSGNAGSARPRSSRRTSRCSSASPTATRSPPSASNSAREEADRADARVAAGETDLPQLLGVPATIKELHRGRGHAAHRRLPAPARVPRAGRRAGGGAAAGRRARSCSVSATRLARSTGSRRTTGSTDARRTPTTPSAPPAARPAATARWSVRAARRSRSARTWAARSAMPAFFNGIFGHLPSPGLVPITGHFPMPSGEFRRTLVHRATGAAREDLDAGAADHRRPGRRTTRTP